MAVDPQLQSLINIATKRLRPVPTLSRKLPFQRFQKPFSQFAKGIAERQTPFFNFFTADPFRQRLRSNIAAAGGAQTGFAQDVAQRTLRELFQPLIQQQQDIQEQFRGGVTVPLFQKRIQRFGESPAGNIRF